MILDAAVIIHVIKPDIAKTFFEYSSLKFQAHIFNMFSKFERVDIIFDRYVEGSLKQEERMKRGQGGRIKVKGSTKIPTNWNAFLQNDDNKKELYEFLAIEIAKAEIPQGKTLVATKNEGVVHFPIDSATIGFLPATMKKQIREFFCMPMTLPRKIISPS